MTKPPVRPSSAPTGRKLGQKVKKGKLKASSRRWIERHLNDPYVQKARQEGYRSRAVYKLLEIDDKHSILKNARRIIDLGAAPGGWSQIAAIVTGSTEDYPKVSAIDFLEMDAIPGVTFLQMDFLEDAAPQKLMDALGGAPDVVLSDMAAPTTGHARTDHLRTMYLCEVAAHFAIDVLAPGGHFLAKTFQGGTESDLLNLLKRNFRSVVHVKPPSSRMESVEMFVLAKGFKGRQIAAPGEADEDASDQPAVDDSEFRTDAFGDDE